MARSHSSTLAWQRLPIALLLIASVSLLQHAAVADDGNEREQLTAVIRQLDMIERLVEVGVDRPHGERTRYHFDYARLRADLQRIRTGIDDYLTPQRAQPRDPAMLLGDYRRENDMEVAP
ncbi:RAQPRD family integrative conjugative element protein [Billgrantia endophytica]|uniref:Raqprd family integrative conjugative element protein n=1 Tax=Billgrantia endophytica TaxID=2033802 RepID=A0A2N7U4C0_9GAMM|nr:RAQPRD family integrative conjugative element protein [Halomonas endophytica]PMR75269.1 raqprd family integrative conjugative element protein [Halomonas endophytica]